MRIRFVVFHVAGNNFMGTGHTRRAFMVAKALHKRCEGKVRIEFYYNRNKTDEGLFDGWPYKVRGFNTEKEMLQQMYGDPVDLWVNDALEIDARFLMEMRANSPWTRIVSFDDVGRGAKQADKVLNPFTDGVDTEDIHYGEKYFVLNEAVTNAVVPSVREVPQRIFVCFGGADPADYSDLLATVLSEDKYDAFERVLVVGKVYGDYARLSAKCRRKGKVKLLRNVPDLWNYMKESDVAVTSRGITAYELGAMGIPTLTIAENALEEKHTFPGDEHGYRYLGRNPSKETVGKVLDELLFDGYEVRVKMREKLLAEDLGGGIDRVVDILYEQLYHFKDGISFEGMDIDEIEIK